MSEFRDVLDEFAASPPPEGVAKVTKSLFNPPLHSRKARLSHIKRAGIADQKKKLKRSRTSFDGGQNGQRCRGAAGFAMLEALVAIVVLAVGVLGVASLLLNSSRFTQQASYDTTAMQLATEMAERMRANPAVSQTGAAVEAITQNRYFIDTATGQPPALTAANSPYAIACPGTAANWRLQCGQWL